MVLGQLRVLIRTILSRRPDLLKPEYRAKVEAGAHPLTGHCYVASEVAYHLLGGPSSEWRPRTVRHEGEVHWFLRHRGTGDILDLTADQFQTKPPYEHARRGGGFLTLDPSKRANAVMMELATIKPVHLLADEAAP